MLRGRALSLAVACLATAVSAADDDATVALVPGSIDLNPLCYECPNETYAEMVMQKDPLIKAHTKVTGSCASKGYDKPLMNDPVFKDAKLFRKGQSNDADSPVALVPGNIDLNPLCYECPNETYAEMVMQKDPLIKAHAKVTGSCASKGYSKPLINDPVFKDAKLFRKGQSSDGDSPVALVPGSHDLNPLCYECPNETYAELVMQKDPLIKLHAKVDGSCSSQGYGKPLINDPVFKDAKLFRKGQGFDEDSAVALIPGKLDLNPVCYECPNETYAELVMQKDPLVKAHAKVAGSCSSQGYGKTLGNDPVFPDAKLFRKGQQLQADAPVALVPGKVDLNPVCYECPNETYAELVMQKDPLVKAHAKVDGSCSGQGYGKVLGNDPVFPDAKLFRKGSGAFEIVV